MSSTGTGRAQNVFIGYPLYSTDFWCLQRVPVVLKMCLSVAFNGHVLVVSNGYPPSSTGTDCVQRLSVVFNGYLLRSTGENIGFVQRVESTAFKKHQLCSTSAGRLCKSCQRWPRFLRSDLVWCSSDIRTHAKTKLSGKHRSHRERRNRRARRHRLTV